MEAKPRVNTNNPTLSSYYFFDRLRMVLRKAGLLPGEENLAVGAYFAAISSFQPYPLRLHMPEKTEGNSAFIIGKVKQLLLPGTITILAADENDRWERLKEDPEHKVVWVKNWGETWASNLDLQGNTLKRTVAVLAEGRVVENEDQIEAPFAIISPGRPSESYRRSRWLTMPQRRKKPKPNTMADRKPEPLDEQDCKEWRNIHATIRERAGARVDFPEWQQLLLEWMVEAEDERSALHIPVVLQCWRTMALLRSFISHYGTEQGTISIIAPTFEDYAAAALFCRGLFYEGKRFPSAAKIFNAILPTIAETDLLHPLSGKPIKYRKPYKPTAQWESLI